MMENEITNRLINYISSNIIVNKGDFITPATPLISSGMIDSFGLVDLALFVEDEFEVEIGDNELNTSRFDSVSELSKIIWLRQKNNTIPGSSNHSAIT